MTATASSPALRKNSVGLFGSIATVVTTLAPAISALYTVPFLAATSGIVSPAVLIAAAIIGLMLGHTLSQLAQQIVSSGSYFTYVSVILGKRLGFLVGWVYLLFYPVAAGMLGALFGFTLQTITQAEWGWSVPWWIAMLVFAAVVLYLSWLGVEISMRTTVTLGSIEILIILVLSVWGLADPGRGGTTFAWLDIFHSGGGKALFLGFVFSIYSFVGFDASVPLAEETKNPKKIVPLAAMGSIVAMMIFFVITTWGQFSGWGIDRLASFATSAEVPAIVLAKQYWGWLWVLVLLAFINSVFGAGLSCVNASARILYSMSNAGVLPKAFGRISARRGTPVGGLVVQGVVSLVIGLGLSAVVGVGNIYSFTGLLFTFALAFVFIVANVALVVLYRTKARHEFNWWKHLLIPVVTTASLIVVVYYSVDPWPAAPFKYALPAVGVWLVLGIVVLVIRRSTIDAADVDSVVVESPAEARATALADGFPAITENEVGSIV